MSSSSVALTLAFTLLACEASSIGSTGTPDQALVSAPRPAERAPDKPADLAWGGEVAWRGWDDALRTAKAENKSVCLVVYADWCPICKEFAPEFNKPEVARAAEGLIMVRQNQDEHPPWLKERLGQYGNYLPRVFFLAPTGEVREDLQSGHPRYPYFYAPMVIERLVANMQAASRR